MTVKELSSVYYIKKEIDMISEKIMRLETQAEKITQSLSDMPPSQGVSDRVGEAAAKLADYHRALAIKQANLLTEQDRLMKYIYTIPDSQTRLIFIYRFIDLMSWQQVAYKVGGYNTADSVRKHVKRFFKKI